MQGRGWSLMLPSTLGVVTAIGDVVLPMNALTPRNLSASQKIGPWSNNTIDQILDPAGANLNVKSRRRVHNYKVGSSLLFKRGCVREEDRWLVFTP